MYARGAVTPANSVALQSRERCRIARPTLIGGVPPTQALAQERIFGPVLVALSFRDENGRQT
ncbi:hypothetical protein XH92_36275 [Bradyrhizobium sp. CCBAU 53421]|nr:hypothetical protein XH92_36275 [Bradyrhizobium sp. CCBAU 53421]